MALCRLSSNGVVGCPMGGGRARLIWVVLGRERGAVGLSLRSVAGEPLVDASDCTCAADGLLVAARRGRSSLERCGCVPRRSVWVVWRQVSGTARTVEIYDTRSTPTRAGAGCAEGRLGRG